MITVTVRGQEIEKFISPLIVADSIDYITAAFHFLSSDWDGLTKYAHFSNGKENYDIKLIDDVISADKHLNFTAGEWTLWIHGSIIEGGELRQRITTDEVTFYVKATGVTDTGNPFPSAVPSMTEQILAEIGDIELLETANKQTLVDAINEVFRTAGGEISPELIAEVVRDYLEKNPVETITDHSELSGRNKADQHSISAVTGLQTALDGKQPKGEYLTEEKDPTVPEWAKKPEKPTYTAEEVGALPDTTEIPSLDGYATEQFVRDEIGKIELPEAGEGVTDHAMLTGRDKAGQHPISAITDLQKTLDEKQPLSNLVTELSETSTDKEYPSAKAVFDALNSLTIGLEHQETNSCGITLYSGYNPVSSTSQNMTRLQPLYNKAGIIESIYCQFTSSVPATIIIAIIENNLFKLVGRFTINNYSTLRTQYKNGEDFIYTEEIPENALIGCEYSSGTRPYYGGSGKSYSMVGLLSSGSIASNTPTAYNISFGAEITSIVTENIINNTLFARKIDLKALESKVEDQLKASDHNRFTVYDELPTNKNIYVDSDRFCCEFTISDTSGYLRLKRGTQESSFGQTAAVFADFSTQTIGFYPSHIDGSANSILKSVSSIPFTAGRKYFAKFEKIDGLTYRFTVTDAGTLESSSVEASVIDAGVGWGKRYYSSSGCTVSNVKNYSLQNSSPKLAILGDSFIEGNSLQYGGYLRYAALLRECVGYENIFINGQGGADAADGVAWFSNYLSNILKPRYVLLAFGMNDTNYSTWLNNMQSLIEMVTEIGASPILATIPPVTSTTVSNTVHKQMNDWIRASGFKYIDIAEVMSLNNDGVTADASALLSDGIHPTIASHERIFRRILCDLVDLIR